MTENGSIESRCGNGLFGNEKLPGHLIERGHVTPCRSRNYGAALLAGFVGGNIASFVKWGAEEPWPPRLPDRPIPTIEVLKSAGIDPGKLVYHYSGHALNLGSIGVHQAFSIVFALLYTVAVEVCPGIALWQGAAFGLVITALFHAVILPLGGWAPPFSQLPFAEILSETLGHVLWAWAIELIRSDVRGRIVRKSWTGSFGS